MHGPQTPMPNANREVRSAVFLACRREAHLFGLFSVSAFRYYPATQDVVSHGLVCCDSAFSSPPSIFFGAGSMRIQNFVKATAVALACVTWVLPLEHLQAGPPQAATPHVASSPVRDIVLGADGSLSGQVLDHQGHPQANQIVLIQQPGQQPRQTVSDAQGRFIVPNVRAGVYHLAADGSVFLCRCWATGTAPPAARDEVLLVPTGFVERGQRPIGEILANPLLIGLIIAAAIAIPIAVHNSKDDAS
jgi:hypothetical protein